MAQFMYSAQSVNYDWNYAAVIGVMLMVLSLFGSLTLAGFAQLVIMGRRYR